MSLPRFFLENQILAHEADLDFKLDLSQDDAKHAKVLRLQPGEHIAVVDASKDYFECEIVSFASDIVVRIAQHAHVPLKRPTVILLQGLCKGEKMDDVIRHATELGVSSFVPLSCDRSIVKLDEKRTAARLKRWRSIAKSAAMQSGQPCIPDVAEPLSPSKVSELLKGITCFLICWEEEHAMGLHEAMSDALSKENIASEDAVVAVAVGPEGGFSEREVQLMRTHCCNSYSITLGPSILRTETAGIVASALTMYELGGLQ